MCEELRRACDTLCRRHVYTSASWRRIVSFANDTPEAGVCGEGTNRATVVCRPEERIPTMARRREQSLEGANADRERAQLSPLRRRSSSLGLMDETGQNASPAFAFLVEWPQRAHWDFSDASPSVPRVAKLSSYTRAHDPRGLH